MTIIYGIYYSIAKFKVIAWGSALKNHIQKLLNLHQKIITLIINNENVEIRLPL